MAATYQPGPRRTLRLPSPGRNGLVDLLRRLDCNVFDADIHVRRVALLPALSTQRRNLGALDLLASFLLG